MLQWLHQKVGMPMVLLSLAVGGFCLSVALNAPEQIQTSPISLPSQANAALPAAELLNAPSSHQPAPHALQEDSEDPFEHLIIEASTRYGVEPELIRAVIMAESRFDPKAVSPKGAIGLMQLMPMTAKAMGVDDLLDPQDNISAGVKYIRLLLDDFEGDVTLALAAYHAGSSRVRRHGGVPPIGATHRYVKEVFQHYDSYKKETSS
jgi:soluble lytic murein transglycosylase-like protein